MVKKLHRTGAGTSLVRNKDGDLEAALGLTAEEVGRLEPEVQDLIRLGVEKLTIEQRQQVSLKVFEQLQAQEARREYKQRFWGDLRLRLDELFKEVQIFVRGEKAPTKFSTPPLGQGANLNDWRARMLKVAKAWRRGQRVDVTPRRSDDGALTLYFDDFSNLDRVTTFAARITRDGTLSSVEYIPGKGEVEHVLGQDGRAELASFFALVEPDDRGHAAVFRRFKRRLSLRRAPSAQSRTSPSLRGV